MQDYDLKIVHISSYVTSKKYPTCNSNHSYHSTYGSYSCRISHIGMMLCFFTGSSTIFERS